MPRRNLSRVKDEPVGIIDEQPGADSFGANDCKRNRHVRGIVIIPVAGVRIDVADVDIVKLKAVAVFVEAFCAFAKTVKSGRFGRFEIEDRPLAVEAESIFRGSQTRPACEPDGETGCGEVDRATSGFERGGPAIGRNIFPLTKRFDDAVGVVVFVGDVFLYSCWNKSLPSQPLPAKPGFVSKKPSNKAFP